MTESDTNQNNLELSKLELEEIARIRETGKFKQVFEWKRGVPLTPFEQAMVEAFHEYQGKLYNPEV